MHPATLLVALLALLSALAGCAPVAANDDDVTEEVTPHPCPDAPAPSHPCLEGCGNDYKVGYPCSPGGGECSTNTFPEAIFCTVDFESTTDLHYCTKPCVDDLDCGLDAFCTGDPDNPASGRGCFPLSCWEPDFWEDDVPAPFEGGP